jgi:ribosomal protein S18 acetylase RimI-like enzyme
MEICAYRPDDEHDIISLWRRCDLTRPWNDPHADIARKLRVNPEMFLVGVIGEKVVATVMAGYDGHRGWINYLGVDPEHRGKGLARAIVERAEQLLRDAGCPKINLQVRSTNKDAIAFYERVGYRVDDVLSMGKRLQDDDA